MSNELRVMERTRRSEPLPTVCPHDPHNSATTPRDGSDDRVGERSCDFEPLIHPPPLLYSGDRERPSRRLCAMAMPTSSGAGHGGARGRRVQGPRPVRPAKPEIRVAAAPAPTASPPLSVNSGPGQPPCNSIKTFFGIRLQPNRMRDHPTIHLHLAHRSCKPPAPCRFATFPAMGHPQMGESFRATSVNRWPKGYGSHACSARFAPPDAAADTAAGGAIPGPIRVLRAIGETRCAKPPRRAARSHLGPLRRRPAYRVQPRSRRRARQDRRERPRTDSDGRAPRSRFFRTVP